MNDQARNRLSQIMTKCNQGEKSLTPQETTIITLLAILNHSLIDRKQIQTSIPYIDQLTEKVQAIKEACKAENQSIPDVDQVVKELDVLCSLQFRSKRTPGFQLDKRLKRTLTKLALSMERLGQETEDLQQLYFSEPSKRPFVQHPALANFLSEENRNIFTLRGFYKSKFRTIKGNHGGVSPSISCTRHQDGKIIGGNSNHSKKHPKQKGLNRKNTLYNSNNFMIYWH